MLMSIIRKMTPLTSEVYLDLFSKKIGSSSDLTPEEVEADTGRHSLDYGQKQVLNSKEKR